MPITDILIGGARVLYAPVGESIPDENTIGWDAAWGGNWTEVGYTSAAVSLGLEYEEHDIKVQQHLGTVKRVRTGEDATIETVLAELTCDNLQLATGGTVTDTVAGAGQVGKSELVSGDLAELDERLWGFEGLRVDANGNLLPTRFFFWKATSTLNGALEFAKESETGISLQIKALVDTSQARGERLFKRIDVTAPATS